MTDTAHSVTTDHKRMKNAKCEAFPPWKAHCSGTPEKHPGFPPWKAPLLTVELMNHTASKSRCCYGSVLFFGHLRDFSSFGGFSFPLQQLFSGLVLWAVPHELISIFDLLSPTNRPLIYRTFTERGASSVVEEGVEISTEKNN